MYTDEHTYAHMRVHTWWFTRAHAYTYAHVGTHARTHAHIHIRFSQLEPDKPQAAQITEKIADMSSGEIVPGVPPSDPQLTWF